MFRGVVDRLQEYFKVKAELIKLEVMAQVAKLLSHVIVFSVMGFLALFVVFFLSFGLGVYLNEVLSSSFWGYLIVSGVYLIGFMIVGLLGRSGKIQEVIERLLIKLNDQIEDEDDE